MAARLTMGLVSLFWILCALAFVTLPLYSPFAWQMGPGEFAFSIGVLLFFALLPWVKDVRVTWDDPHTRHRSMWE